MTNLNYFLSFILFSIVVFSNQNDECYKNCENSKHGCKTQLLKSNGKSQSGIYKLNQGFLNLSCLFESLPRVVNIKWKFKSSPNILNPNYLSDNMYENNNDREIYKNIKCDQLKYSHDCSDGTEGHLSFSNCLLEVRNIRMTGYYKCDAVNPLTGQILGTGVETKVRVIGLQSVDVVKSRLVPMNSGYVQIKVCANSYPSITWILKSTILQPNESKYYYSSSQISNVPFYNIDEKEDMNFQSLKQISQSDPYCHYVQLFIGKVKKEIEDLHVGITNDNGYSLVKLNVRVENKSYSNKYKLNKTTVVLLFFLYFYSYICNILIEDVKKL